MSDRLLVDDRQINRVATAAHPRGFDERIVLRFDSERIVHRVGDKDVVSERPGQLVGFASLKQARDRMIEEMFQRRDARRGFVFRDVMTGRAADSIARQGAILKVWVLHLAEVHNLAIEIRATAMVQVELPLAHYAMTAEASVNYFPGQLLSFRLVLERLQVSQFTIQLGIENRIAL